MYCKILNNIINEANIWHYSRLIKSDNKNKIEHNKKGDKKDTFNLTDAISSCKQWKSK